MAKMKPGKKRPSPGSVLCIDLTGDDDDDKEERLGQIRKVLNPASAASSLDRKPAARASTQQVDSKPKSKRARIKEESRWAGTKPVILLDDDDDDDDEIEVVQPTEAPIIPVARMPTGEDNDDDDVKIVGAVNELRLPHMRQHCTECKFNATECHVGYSTAALEANSKTCDLCYCYVCDAPVKECKSWRSSTSSASVENHCCASDQVAKWVSLRSRAKNPASSNTSTLGRANDGLDYELMIERMISNQNRNQSPIPSTRTSLGPFPPDNEVAPKDRTLTKCRKCSWFSRLKNTDARGYGSLDWCHHCGRVASDRDLGKYQTDAHELAESDIYLGMKEIPFRIKAHDPRLFSNFKENWEKADTASPAWTYNNAEMEEEVFRHRLGERPKIRRIIESIPVLPENEIPQHGRVRKAGDYMDYGCVRDHQGTDSHFAEETEAVILEKESHVRLFQVLYDIQDRGVNLADITAKWDKATGSGLFTVKAYIPKDGVRKGMGRYTCGPVDHSLSYLLGFWFEIFPFALTDIGGLMKAKEDRISIPDISRLSQLPISMSPAEFSLQVKAKIAEAAQEYNGRADSNHAKLPLVSSISALRGGTCDSDPSLAGILKRYYREQSPRLLLETWNTAPAFIPFVNNKVSLHRGLRQNHQSSCQIMHILGDGALVGLVGPKDAALAIQCLRRDAQKIKLDDLNIQSIMSSLENLGHARVDYVDGLHVELLDFQKQALKWALEREQTPGGIQTYFWAKLPPGEDRKTPIYFNPVLQKFRVDPPRVVRGGFIAAEMGLGKTVISLALILKNPAPAMPASCSPIACLDSSASSIASAHGWDKDLYTNTSSSNAKRGSILSHGTLVICPVSLVGQWIDEAKSKLSNPGLIYPYHGQNRKRDANVLAQNSIVVTTYQVLASDATYHAGKAGADYCAPLEQIRWWRVICDEGHWLRESQTKRSKAVFSLVADHKWLVSGTPLNTSVKDLKNQLKFLGIEDVEGMFQKISAPAPRGRSGLNSPQKLLFLLRSIMLRHTQNQKYRGTSTTLMSLPPKTERKIEVTFAPSEKAEYQALEKKAQDYYVTFRAGHSHEISKHFFKLSQKLSPLRVACSGGKYPIHSENNNEEDTDVLEEAEESGIKKKKTQVKFSDFVFTGKFKVLLSELERARDKDPTSKSLVFSQFASTLQYLQSELPKHGFQFRTLSGAMTMKQRARSLHDFQSDPPTTIFLLSMRAGAVGINLTQANRVFLMEPSFNPALESQAIGRVHRLGQTRSVEVVRLVAKDTVENRLMKHLAKKYVSSTTTEADASSDISEADAKSNEKNPNLGLVGNVQTDRAQIMMGEFDLLFGVESLTLEGHNEEADDSADFDGAAPDNVMSLTTFLV